MQSVLLCGTSTRAAAESAARAGFRVTTIDAFADLDQHPAVHALSISRDFGAPPTASAIARAARRVEADAVVYLSPFENHPRAVAALASGRRLWGNSPDTLRRVRNPFLLTEALREHGFAVPNLSNLSNDSNDSNDSNEWILKPFHSGGGRRVSRWDGRAVSRTSFLQQRIDGTPGSVVFLAANGEAVPLGFSRQIVGDPNFGANGYRYCGSIAAAPDDRQFTSGRALLDAATALARYVTLRFGLVGLNGIDFVERDGVPYPIEVNPRWSASMEIAEPSPGGSFLLAHSAACADGSRVLKASAGQLDRRSAAGKAIVYARRSGCVGDTSSWLGDPAIRDVPHGGQSFRAGQPVCTVLAEAADAATCYWALVGRARRVYAELGTLSESGRRTPRPFSRSEFR